MGAPCPLSPSGLRFTARSAHVATPTQRTSLYEQGRIQRLKKGGHTYRVEIGAVRVGRSYPCAR